MDLIIIVVATTRGVKRSPLLAMTVVIDFAGDDTGSKESTRCPGESIDECQALTLGNQPPFSTSTKTSEELLLSDG